MNCTPNPGHPQTGKGCSFVSKISYEQKISAVELVASGVNIQEASRRSGISKTYLRQLWLRYRNGDNLRSREKTQQTYNDEFKLMVLETMRRDRLSYQETAVRFHIVNISIIHAWRVKFASEGPDRRQPQKKGRRLPMSCYQTPFCELPTPQEDKTSNGNTSTPNVPRGTSRPETERSNAPTAENKSELRTTPRQKAYKSGDHKAAEQNIPRRTSPQELPADEQSRLRQLEEENAELRMENDYLKKLSALILQRKKQPAPKNSRQSKKRR